MSPWFAKCQAIAQFCANVVVIAGVLFFFHQLRVDKEVQASDKSFELVQAFQSGEGGRARQSAIAPFWEYSDVFRANRISSSSYIAFIKQLSDQNKELTLNISIVDFWMKIAFECGQSGSCSAPVNSQMFEPLATDIYCLYSPLFLEWREELNIADFGQHITYYSKSDSCNFIDG